VALYGKPDGMGGVCGDAIPGEQEIVYEKEGEKWRQL
jgi:hypothetical protein